jgi:putative ABC transport system permease protein
MGRIRDGVTMEAAQEEMTAIAAGLEEQYPDDMEGQGARLVLAREELVGRYTGQLLMLLGAAGLVLLIVCGNVAGLLIAKSTTRQTEVAVRASLGASRLRLIRQLLTENVPLFLVGGGLAVLLSIWGVQVLRATIPTNIPRVEGIGLDGWVLTFTLGISILTGVLFGLIPAFSVSKTDLSDSLKQGRARWGKGRSRARTVLVVAQFALTLVLANGAALMLESYWSLRNQDQGFRTEGVLTIMLNPQGPRYEGEGKVFAFYQQALERIETIPGVIRAAATSKLPLNGGTNSWMTVEGKDYGDERGPLVEMSVVSYDYIEAMGIPLIKGRNLTEQDSAAGQPGVLINQTAAKVMWPDEDPLGKRFQNNPEFWFTVVGVVQDVRQWGIEREPIPETYMPHIHGQENSFVWVRYIVARTEVDPLSVVGPVKEAIWSVDPSLPVSGLRTTQQLVSQSLARRTFNTILIGVFAALGLILVAAGTYGVMSYFVSQRTHEIGLRMALGSNRSGVLQLVFKQGLKLAAVGVTIGVVGVFAAQKLTASMIYGVSPVEPWTLVGGTLFLVTVGAVGTLVPARRASRIDPVLALREE